MISHSSNEAILGFLQELKSIYEKKLAEITGKILNYLGMTFDFSFCDELKFIMTQYVSKVIAVFPEEIVAKLAMHAADHLFEVRDNGRKLDQE